MVKATSSGHVKETAHKLVTSDMPLYFPCPCRSSKPLMAQMMRVFVVTPDSPILVTLNPRIQPSVPPCPVFYPGVAAGFSLPPSSFCVLRLPYVYVSEGGPILPPGDSQPLLSCRVLKGMFSAMGHSQDISKGYAVPGKRWAGRDYFVEVRSTSHSLPCVILAMFMLVLHWMFLFHDACWRYPKD